MYHTYIYMADDGVGKYFVEVEIWGWVLWLVGVWTGSEMYTVRLVEGITRFQVSIKVAGDS